MREIKFRVWWTKAKEYDYPTRASTALKYIEGCSETTLEQYTGLRDKNGVEIYEGDTVVIHGYTDRGGGSPDPYIGNVSWENGAFQINGADLLYHLEGVDEFEVIGNMHTEGAG